MPRWIDRKTATRAIDAWMRRLLHRHRRGVSRGTTPGNPEIAEARRDTRDALVDAVVDAKVSDELCRDASRGKRILASRLEERSAEVVPRVERLERMVERHPPLRRRYQRLLEGLRGLIDPEDRAPARLLCELCLVSSLSRDDSRIPWARRR